MPAPTRPKARQRYTQEDVRKALDAIKNNGYSISAASRDFNVPKTTLHDKLSGKYKEEVPVGRPSVLSIEEEDLIVQWVLDVAKAGFPVTKNQLIGSVSKLIKDLDRPNPFNNNVPGDRWYNLFLNRHPVLAKRVSQALTSSRAHVSEDQLRAWFEEVRTYLHGKGLDDLFDDPRRVFNADETAFFLCPKGEKVLAKKGERAVYQQTGNDEKECLTVLVNANAAGEMAPPMVVFSYERVPTNIVRNFPGEWGLGKSESGWMTMETFYEYITNVFHPWLLSENITFPVVLFIDGHTSHLSKYLSDYCSANKIEVVALYPNATHLLQPLDVAVFRPLKLEWKNTVNQWRFANDGRRLRKEEFAPLLHEAMSKLDKRVIVNGFKATGLDKLDPENVHYNLMLKKSSTTPNTSSVSLERKVSELRGHLSYLETKIGLTKVRMFAQKEVQTRDESLFEVWTDIKQELKTAVDRLAAIRTSNANKNNSAPTSNAPIPGNIPVHNQVDVDDPQTLIPDDDPDDPNVLLQNDVLATPLIEEGEDLTPVLFEEGQLLAEGSGSLNESGLQNIIDDLGFSNFDIGMSVDLVVVPGVGSEELMQTPSEVVTVSKSVTSLLASPPSTPKKSFSTPLNSSTPNSNTSNPSALEQRPSTSITSLYDNPIPSTSTGEASCFSTPIKNMPSPFKRCLPYPSPTSLRKKMKSREPIPAAVTGESYKLYLQRKEERKQQQEELKEQRRIIRETKKIMKKEKGTSKKQSMNKKGYDDTVDSNSDGDDPAPIEPEDLENLSVNSWVVVPYVVEGEKQFFPGQIKALNKDTISIKFLSRKGNKFVWPEDDDVDNDVSLSEIVQVLNAPTVERRGFFSFKEKIISK